MSEAYLTALTELRERLARHELDADDLVFTVDADGQHDLHVLDELVEMTRAEGPRREHRPARPLVSRAVQAHRQLGALEVGERLGRRAAARRRVRLPHLPPRRARARARLLLGLPVQRDRRGRGRALPARLQRPQRPRRAGAGRPVAHPAARRRHRPRGHPGRGGPRVAPRPRCREAFRTDAIAHLSIAGVLGVLIALTLQRSTDTVFTVVPRRARRVRSRRAPAPLRFPGRRSRCSVRSSRSSRRGSSRNDPIPASAIVLVGRLRRRRGAGRAGRAPARARSSSPARSSVLVVIAIVGIARASCSALAVGAVFVAAVVSRFGRFGLPAHAPAAHARARQHARRRGERAHRLLRCEHGRRDLVRRRRGARPAHVGRGRDHVRRRPRRQRDARRS